MLRSPALLSILVATATCVSALAADREVTVKFTPGTTSAAFKATIRGYDTVNYYLEARAGQRLSIDFGKNRNSCYFNVLSPADGKTLVDGSAIDPEGLLLEESGRYRVVAYLMRAAARRGASCTFSIDFEIKG